MGKCRIIAIAILIFTGRILDSHAAELNLDMAVKEALQTSPEIQKYRSEVDAAYSKKLESYTGFLPSLSGDINYLFAKKFAVIPVTIDGNPATFPQIISTSQFLATAELPVFDGFSNIQVYKSSSSLYESAQNELAWAEFKKEMETTLLFYKSLAAKSLLAVAEQNVSTLNDHYKDVQALYKAGVSTKFDVLRVEVQANEAQAELLLSQDEFEFSKIRLAKTMGKDSDDRSLTGELPVITEAALGRYKEGEKSREDLTALALDQSSFAHLQNATGRYWIPRISLIGQIQAYNNVNDDFADWDAYRNAYNAGVNLHWNIFDSMTSISRNKTAKAQQIKAESDLRSASLQASEDMEIWKRKFLYFCKLVDVKNNQTVKAQEAYRLARESVRAGTKTNSDLLDAELDLFKSRADALNAQVGVVEALINLELASGQRLFEFRS